MIIVYFYIQSLLEEFAKTAEENQQILEYILLKDKTVYKGEGH
jgi:hypothetical protein